MDEYMCHVGNVANKTKIAQHKLTPLMVAIHANDKAMVELLLIANPEMVNEADENGCKPISFVNDVEIMRMLFSSKNIEINKEDQDAITKLLYSVVHNKDIDLVSLLLGHSVCIIDKDIGCTPLHVASIVRSAKIAQMLLQHDGTLLDVQDAEGYTALMYAVEYGYEDVVTLLLGHQANYALFNHERQTVHDLVSNDNIRKELNRYVINNWILY